MFHLHQIVLVSSTLLSSWLGMQAVHELGHVLAAKVTGATVTRVVLHPTTISRTDVENNSRPLVVVWGGPIVGVVVPLLGWRMAARLHCASAFLWRFFAGFCLIANGAYIAFGSFEGIGDCGDLLRHGSAMWQLWLFGTMTIPVGIWLWHGLDMHFGLGQAKLEVSSRLAWTQFLVAMAIVATEVLFSGL